jgi:uncharacterized protein YyaL (SSP411 family)
MAEGGLYDQLGGGFARYSTDDRWLVPHFEKMLYDNAQLLRVCAGLAARGDKFFRKIALETADYLRRDLRHSGGAFYSAEDADSEGKEGAFYLWTLAELKSVLGDDAGWAAGVLDVTVNGNFMDPHTREVGKNVLHLAEPVTPADQPRLDRIKQRLFQARLKRVRPHRDEKILTEWNGLAISAFAVTGFLLNEPTLIEDAARAAGFVEAHLFDAAKGRLYRRWRDDERAIAGHQTDYAMMIEGLLDLFETTGEARWLRFALRLAEIQDQLFFDATAGGYFMSEATPDLIVRMKDDGDNVIPSGNSVAVMNGLRLTAFSGRAEFREKALATMRLFATSLADRSFTVCKMVPALDFEQTGHAQVVVVGSPAEPSRLALADRLKVPAVPLQKILLAPDQQPELASLLPHVAGMKPIGNRAAAYVCRDFTCREPVMEPDALAAQVQASHASLSKP